MCNDALGFQDSLAVLMMHSEYATVRLLDYLVSQVETSTVSIFASRQTLSALEGHQVIRKIMDC